MALFTSQETPTRAQGVVTPQRYSVSPILVRVRTWGLRPADLLWAIEHGAARPNDKRSRQLQGCAMIGGARLKPFDGEWMLSRASSGDGRKLAACIEHAQKVLVRLVDRE